MDEEFKWSDTAMQQRETTTNRLADIIQVIKIGHRTGTLTVERSENVVLEEGMIVFVHGQMTQAVIGSLTGVEAFKWLSQWGPCRFRFITSPPTSSNETYHLPTTSPPNDRERGGIAEASVLSSSLSGRTQQVESILSRMEYAGLSRVHRHLFLLIDGRRTVEDFARLMGRKREEVQKLLNDLERADFIQQ